MLKEVEKASEALDLNSESILLQPVIFVIENPDASFEKGIKFFVGYTYSMTCFRGLSVDN
jgi:hypothetical protein